MNETIPSEDINFVPYTELFPNTVIGGVEVNDSISSPTKTYSSEKIENRFTETTESLNDSIDDAVSGIDLSNYQLTSEKNSANGYQGLDANGFLPSRNIERSANSLLSYYVNFWSDNSSGKLYLFANSVLSWQSQYIARAKIKNGNSSALVCTGLVVSSGQVGYNYQAIANTQNNLYSPFIHRFDAVVSGTITAKSNDICAIMGTLFIAGATNTGNGLFIRHNSTRNSGNWTYGKVVSSALTELNSSISYLSEDLVKLTIIYNKASETASFYVNNNLLGSLTSVNLPNTINLWNMVGYAANDNTDTTARSFGWFSSQGDIYI